MPNYGTGFSLLPPVGTLSYNGVQFSALFSSHCNGTVVQDDAGRTTKWVEWVLIVDGYVTLRPGETTTDQTWDNLRQKLTETGATLIYAGNGFGDLIVNQPGGEVQDLAWGPIPKILEFQTMGATGAAKIKWQVICHVPEINLSGGNGPITQFNYSATISYDEQAYSTITIEGVLEMGMTRTDPGITFPIPTTIDAFRQLWLDINIDLNNFHVPKRDFRVSPDMRTCQWSFSATQLSPMGLPAGCTAAGGNVTIRPVKKGSGPLSPALGIMWTAQMRATYTVPPNMPRRLAAEAFFLLLWFRMNCSANQAPIPQIGNNANAPQQPPQVPPLFALGATILSAGTWSLPIQAYNAITAQAGPTGARIKTNNFSKVLTDLVFDEGLYNDSKQMNFSASWTFASTFDQIISASGMWKRGPECAAWGDSMRNSYGVDIAGWRGPLKNQLDSGVMAIVDFGHQDPLNDQLLFVPELSTVLGGGR